MTKFLTFIAALWMVSCSAKPEVYIKPICLGGHVYWHYEVGYRAVLAIKLSPDGKPVPCEDPK